MLLFSVPPPVRGRRCSSDGRGGPPAEARPARVRDQHHRRAHRQHEEAFRAVSDISFSSYLLSLVLKLQHKTRYLREWNYSGMSFLVDFSILRP